MLVEAAKAWVNAFNVVGRVKSPNLQAFHDEDPLLKPATHMHDSCSGCNCTAPWNQTVMVAEVQNFWKTFMPGEGNGPSKLQMHAEAWGLKKLISYTLRRLKTGQVARAMHLA